MDKIIITVHNTISNCTARGNGKVASCTAGEIQAANACARKIITSAFDLKRLPEARPFYSKWQVIPRQ